MTGTHRRGFSTTHRLIPRVETSLARLPQECRHSSYYCARYYDPSVGRFSSEDRLSFRGGINLFRYVRNNATNLRDPSGNSPWSWGGSCAAFFYFAAKCADKGLACKKKLLENAPNAVNTNPSEVGNGDLAGELSKARNGAGTPYEGCMNLSECMSKEDDCLKMAKYAVGCGAFAIKMMGTLFPDLPPSLSAP